MFRLIIILIYSLRRVFGVESSCLFLDAIDKLMILYHALSLHVLHACVIFCVILSMCNAGPSSRAV